MLTGMIFEHIIEISVTLVQRSLALRCKLSAALQPDARGASTTPARPRLSLAQLSLELLHGPLLGQAYNWLEVLREQLCISLPDQEYHWLDIAATAAAIAPLLRQSALSCITRLFDRSFGILRLELHIGQGIHHLPPLHEDPAMALLKRLSAIIYCIYILLCNLNDMMVTEQLAVVSV